LRIDIQTNVLREAISAVVSARGVPRYDGHREAMYFDVDEIKINQVAIAGKTIVDENAARSRLSAAIVPAAQRIAEAAVKTYFAEVPVYRLRNDLKGFVLKAALSDIKIDPSDGYYAVDTYCAAAEPSPEEVETFKRTVLTAVLHGSNLSDVGYGPMTGNASADVAAHQFAKGDPGYQLQAGDAYFREGPFINDFPEISPSALFGLGLGGNTAIGLSSSGAPYCKPDTGSIHRYCSVSEVQ
jgi:hypothetical protein